MPKLLTAREAASIVGVSEDTLWRWIRCGKIEAIKLPTGRVRISEDVVKKILQPKILAN